MIKLTALTAKNFLSIGAVTLGLDLDKHGLTLVLGANSDTSAGVTRNGAGKAQPFTSKIKIPNGWSFMKDIQIGTIVSTPDGGTAKVIGVFPQGKLPIYKLTFSDGRTTEACGNHLWKVWSKTGKWENRILSTSEIAGALHKKVFVPLHVPENINNIDLPIDPKLLGILLGDGSLRLTKTSISSADKEIIDYVQSQLPNDYILVKYNKYDYTISKKNGIREKGDHPGVFTHFLRAPLQQLGLLDTKSYNKFIPPIYKTSSVSQKLALLQGLIDTDGYVGKHGDVSFSTASEQLALDVQDLVRSIGGLASIYEKKNVFYTYKNERKRGRPSFNVKIRYNNPRALVSLSRKLERISLNYQYSNCLRLEIKKIELIGNKEAQCIMIDHPDHLYITDNYVVTHNTTILQAISFALYGWPLSSIRIPNLINNINNKGMLVTLDFERGGIKYRIERGRKPNIMKFFVNNVEVKNDDENDAQGENKYTQIEIDRVIGMSHTMFKHIVALNTYTLPFLRMPVKDQREIIEELLGVTQISQRAEVLKQLRDQTKDSIRDQQSLIRATIEANTRIENAITHAQSLSKEWKLTHEKALNAFDDEISIMRNIDHDKEISIFDDIDTWNTKDREINEGLDAATREISLLEREIAGIEAEISRYITDASNDISIQISRLEQEITRKTSNNQRKLLHLEDERKELSNLLNQIDNPNEHTCSSCNQPLIGTNHLEIVLANIQSKVDLLLKKIEREVIEVETTEKEISDIHDEIKIIQANNVEKKQLAEEKIKNTRLRLVEPKSKLPIQEELVEEYINLRANLGDCSQSIFSSRDEVYKAKGAFDSLVRERELELEKQNPYDAQIETFRDTIQKVDYEPLNDLDLLLKHQEFLWKLLTSKESFIRKKIVEQNLNYLNVRLNHYLEKLGLPHEVQFMNDLSVEISLLSREFEFDQMSRGEANRVILATSLSFRDVWESLNENFNLIFVDELLDSGLDDVGAEAGISLLKSMARDRHKNVFLISHKDSMIARVDHILTVRKEGGFTSFEHE